MVKTRRSKKRRERQRTSAAHHATTHAAGGAGNYLKVPKDAQWFFPKDAGVYNLDVIPYAVKPGTVPNAAPGAEDHYERTFWVHTYIGINNETFICPQKTKGHKDGGPCPICEHLATLYEAGADKDTTRAIKPKERQLFNLTDLDNIDAGMQMMEISYHRFGVVLVDRIVNAPEGLDWEYFADPEDGFTLRAVFKMKQIGKGQPFSECTSIDFMDRDEQYDASIINDAHDLNAMFDVLPYDKLKAIYYEEGDSRGESDDDNTEPTKTKQRKAPAGDPVAEDYGLTEGMTVEEDEFGECTIVKTSADGTSLTLKDKDGEIHRAVAPDEVTVIEEGPRQKKKKKVSKKKAPPPPEDDDDDDWGEGDDEVPFDGEDTEEEEEERPRKKRPVKKVTKKKAPKKKAPVEEDEEEEDDWDKWEE